LNTFGQRLKLLRNEKQFTGEELGKLLNVTKVAVSKWETNDRFPDKDMLIKLADIFNVSIDYLLCRTDIKTALVVKHTVNGKDIELEVNAKAYPNGMTYEEVLKVLEAYEKLKEAGFEMVPKEEK
jgi:transcriptional regulator with XRE-family HTH domain